MGQRYGRKNIARRNPMIISTTPRIPSEIHVPKWLIGFILIGLVVSGIIYAFFFSSTFRVERIIIEGQLKDEIRSVLNQYQNKNIFRVKSKEIEQTIRTAYPEVYDVKVFRGIPDTLKVKANKRKAELLWESNGKVYLLDEYGLAFQEIANDKTAAMSNTIRIRDRQGLSVKIGQRVVSLRFLRFVKGMKDGLRGQTGVGVTAWEIGETSIHVEAITDKNWRILADTSRPVDEQLESLNKILKVHASDITEYVDLRVPGYAYYK